MEDREGELQAEGNFNVHSLENLTIHHHVGNPVSRFHLERLNAQEKTRLRSFSTILITAGENNEMDTINSDSKNLATLMLVRKIQSESWAEEQRNLKMKQAAAKLHTASSRGIVMFTSTELVRLRL